MSQSFVIDKERVDLLMKRAGIRTYTDLATKSGLHPNTLTKVLGGRTWDSMTAQKLAMALDCNPLDLQTAIGFPPPNWGTLAVLSALPS
jgi:lambda repressor-like predicted transcriptional regulator